MSIQRSKLLTIEQYAEHNGVSADVVKACIRRGVIGIRSYKGEKYVVDMPANRHYEKPETSIERPQQNEDSVNIEAGSIARLAEKMLQRASEIKELTAKVKG